jgi:hypothetical protein
MEFQFQHQFVLQWPASSSKDYATLIELEKAVARALGDSGMVVGHDLGAGEMNIFVLTNDPVTVFERITTTFGTRDFMPELKAAYRDLGKNDFTVVYPASLRHFAVA